MRTKHLIFSFFTASLLFSTTSMAGDNWYIKPYLGISSVSDQDGEITGSQIFDGNINSKTDSGFVSGLAWGYEYNNGFSAELAWEYRTNDSDSTIQSTGETFSGNYASNLFYLNGYYDLSNSDTWRYFVGAGIGWTQEIDIDLEQNGVENSYSGDGDIAFQVMLGSQYKINDEWDVNAELRYSSKSSIDFEGEENATGTLTGFDYNPLTLAVGLIYRF